MNKTFRVFNDGEHEYDIVVDETDIPTYFLIRKGHSWSEDSRNEVILKVTNDGNGYKFPKIGKKMDYAEMYEWSIMTNFINSYEAKTFPYTNEITIESCNEIVKFRV